MANLNNIGMPAALNRAFLALVIEAGIASTLRSLVSLGKDEQTLLNDLVDALETDNPALAAVFATGGMMTLRKVLEALQVEGVDGDVSPVVSVYNLPEMIPTSEQAGPASVSAGRDAGEPTQLNVGFSTPPAGYKAELYLDMVFVKTSAQGDSGGTTFDVINDVVAGAHTFRVLYRREAGGAITRFGPIASVDA